jgi:branched-chain amino acid transport system ATP-binding protein
MTGGGPPLLELDGVSKRFGGIVAVNALDLRVEDGQIVGLIGPNGAGKSTAFNCITGIYRADRGTVRFLGEDLVGLPTHAIARRGIARTFQNLELFRDLTVYQNLLTAKHLAIRAGFMAQGIGLPHARRHEAAARRDVDEIIDRLGLTSLAGHAAGRLPFGQQKLVELARALLVRPRLLLLDEPAGGLDTRDRKTFIDLIYRLRGEWGVTLLLIEHDMSVVMRVCDRVAVMDFGNLIAFGTPPEVQRDERVRAAYLGREL